MNRRKFIKNTALASSLLYAPSFLKAFESLSSEDLGYKKLVVIQLSGGNDGLNSLIPFTNDIYYKSRPSLSIKKDKTIKINDELGFNKNLIQLKKLYDKGELLVINNVGYPNPNRSHFRSTDIWQTASDSNKFLDSGWIGRYLDNYANDSFKCIEISDSQSLVMKGEKINGIATRNPGILFGTSQDPYFKRVLNYYNGEHLNEHNLGYLYKCMITAKSSAKYIYETSRLYTTKVSYPNSEFGNQLKTIAKFINSGLNTKVYYCALDGFDTHVNQEKVQSKLLSDYSKSVDTFVKDLKQQNTFKDTLILTFSEFGRRVEQNAANGTDHGAANNVFIIGNKIKKPGIYNNVSNLLDLDENGDIKYEVDFRSIYASILYKWLNVSDSKVLKKKFRQLDFL